MLSAEQMKALITEFPELSDNKINLSKEVYAHFGALFFAYSLIETSLINALVFHHLGVEKAKGSILNREQWESEFDRKYEMACKFTFGNLVKHSIDIEELATFDRRLFKVKKQRDYFAHHFFREEAAAYMIDEGCWQLLWEFHCLRQSVFDLDKDLTTASKHLRKRLSLPMIDSDKLSEEKSRIINEMTFNLHSPKPDFGWQEK